MLILSFLELLITNSILPDKRLAKSTEAHTIDSTANSDVEGVAYKWACTEVETGDVCDLAKDRLDFRRSISTSILR